MQKDREKIKTIIYLALIALGIIAGLSKCSSKTKEENLTEKYRNLVMEKSWKNVQNCCMNSDTHC